MSVYLLSESQNILLLIGVSLLDRNILVSCSQTSIVLSAQVKSVYQKAYLQFISNIRPYISSINTKTADLTGTLLMLGSLCISMVDSTDATDPLSTPNDLHTINIFDGCGACNDCQSVWLVIQTIQLLHIWIVGLKDCVLYYLPTAQTLWSKLNLGRLGTITDLTGKCNYTPRVYNRLQLFGRATKLLYQYKAAVAMWNYLVYNLSSKMIVLPALLDYTGFSIKIKRRFNLCGCADTTKRATLTLYITRIGQETVGISQRQYLLQDLSITDLSLSDNRLINLVPYALGFYVGLVPLNTYILTHTDKGGFNLHNAAVIHYASDADNGITYDLQPILYSSNGISMVSTVGYGFSSADNGQYVCSALLKILPVMLSGQVSIAKDNNGQYTADITLPTAPTQSLSLGLYTLYRKRNSILSDSSLALSNRWLIHACWLGGCASADVSDATYYRTSYNLYPNVDIILSIAQNMVKRALALDLTQ